MTLVIRPVGRGNWRPVRMTIDDPQRAGPMLVQPGARFELGGVVWRVVRVEP